MPDPDDSANEQRVNYYQQPWALFTDALNCLDPAFERFALEYSDQGWVCRRNRNRQPARQIDRHRDERTWVCMGIDVADHWYHARFHKDTLFEFRIVATWRSTLGQSLVHRGSLIEPVPILSLLSRIDALLEEGRYLLDSWLPPEDIPYSIGRIVDGWEAGPYVTRSRETER